MAFKIHASEAPPKVSPIAMLTFPIMLLLLTETYSSAKKEENFELIFVCDSLTYLLLSFSYRLTAIR
jgi:hypothetical protein